MSEATRDITYAHCAETRFGRAVIRAVENTTGRMGLIRRAKGYQDEILNGVDFWDVMIARYRLRLDIRGGSLANIPSCGPLVVVANHPFGILDGLMMGHILSQTRRGEFRILAHQVFRNAKDLDSFILPISFGEDRDALALNLETRNIATRYLAEGGAIGVFPGGTVSTSRRPLSTPMDPSWRSFTAKMIARSGATVVPIYFEGVNSRLFQVASHFHETLRVALLIREFRRRTDRATSVVIGEPIAAGRINAFRNDPKAMMDFLRASTYALSPKPVRSLQYGFDFGAKHKRAMANGRGHFR